MNASDNTNINGYNQQIEFLDSKKNSELFNVDHSTNSRNEQVEQGK